MLVSAREHYRRQQRITAAALLALRRETGGPLAQARVIAAFQLLAARDAASSVPLMLEEQDIDRSAVGTVNAASVAGVASDGRHLDTLVDLSAVHGSSWLEMVAASQIQDAARSAAGLAIAVRPQVHGWIRMLNPPSCSRCAVLAGKFFRWNQGFQRHPRCDCRHIPSQESDYSDVRLSGDKWFHTLNASEQDRIFTKAGAQAIRDGADLNQIVNARRGMATVSYGNRKALVTREGTTKRGIAFDSLSKGGTYQSRDELVTRYTSRGAELRQVRRTRASRPRVMPETIYAAAPSREEAIRLLRLNGFIF